MSKHNELRDKINELCPELMKLEFGCEVEMMDSDFVKTGEDIFTPNCKTIGFGRVLGVFGFCGEDYDGDRALIYSPSWDLMRSITDLNLEDPKDEGYIKILGKDPTLNEILLAIHRRYRGDRLATVASNGWLHFGVDRCFYDVSKPLSQQSSDTVEAILEILK